MRAASNKQRELQRLENKPQTRTRREATLVFSPIAQELQRWNRGVGEKIEKRWTQKCRYDKERRGGRQSCHFEGPDNQSGNDASVPLQNGHGWTDVREHIEARGDTLHELLEALIKERTASQRVCLNVWLAGQPVTWWKRSYSTVSFARLAQNWSCGETRLRSLANFCPSLVTITALQPKSPTKALRADWTRSEEGNQGQGAERDARKGRKVEKINKDDGSTSCAGVCASAAC